MTNLSGVDVRLIEIENAINGSDFDSALKIINTSLTEYPNHYLLYFKQGYIYLRNGDADRAQESLECSIKLNDNATEAILMLASVYYARGEYDKALYYYLQKADEKKIPEVYRTIANIYHEKLSYEEAEKYYRLSLQQNPKYTDAILDLVQMLLGKIVYLISIKEEWIDLAFRYVDIAISHDKKDTLGRAFKLKADLFKMMDHPAEAAVYYRESLKYDPDESTTYSNLCTVLLAQGLFSEGMEQCHWRWQMNHYDDGNNYAPKNLPIPEWQGEVDLGKTVLVKPEQGLGDQILMLQLVNKIKKLGMNVVYYCEPRMKGLVQRSLPDIQVLTPYCDNVDQQLEQLDYQIYLFELVKVFKIEPKTAKPPVPYLMSEKNLLGTFTDKYHCFGEKLKVGIAWQSNSSSYGERKTIPLDLWAPILEIEDVQFISIQYGEVEKQIDAVRDRMGVSIYQDSDVDPINNLDSALAQLDSLDLIISVSNAGAHMAGALGKPVWLLLSCAPLWHWLHNRTDSIWYQDISIFRQKKVHDWRDVMAKVAQQLTQKVHDRRMCYDKSICGL